MVEKKRYVDNGTVVTESICMQLFRQEKQGQTRLPDLKCYIDL